jgi:hypothetical protein
MPIFVKQNIGHTVKNTPHRCYCFENEDIFSNINGYLHR